MPDETGIIAMRYAADRIFVAQQVPTSSLASAVIYIAWFEDDWIVRKNEHGGKKLYRLCGRKRRLLIEGESDVYTSVVDANSLVLYS